MIEGPGLVQRMGRHGIALFGTLADPVEKAVVKNVTSHQNCFSGIWLVLVNNSLVEGVVSARNSAASASRPCGGVCVTNSNNNRVRRSQFFGNGSIALGPPPAVIPNDFGVGLVGSSSNIIEDNGIGGNINGLALFPTAAGSPAGNLIRKNVIVGNPPIEVSAGNPGTDPVGADIRDYSAPGSNTFTDNLCITLHRSHQPTAVPIALDEDGQATGHRRRTVGSVTEAFFEERTQFIPVHGRDLAPLLRVDSPADQGTGRCRLAPRARWSSYQKE